MKIDSISDFPQTRMALEAEEQQESGEADAFYKPEHHFMSRQQALGGQVEIRKDGIFYKSSNGVLQRGMLYNPVVGRNEDRYVHIRQCSALRSEGCRQLMWSNEPALEVRTSGFLGFGSSTAKRILPICPYCMQGLDRYDMEMPRLSSQYVDLLKKGKDDMMFQSKPLPSYLQNIPDRVEERRRILMSHNYVCHVCHRDLSALADRFFVNSENSDNGKCICIRCKCKQNPKLRQNPAMKNLLAMYDRQFGKQEASTKKNQAKQREKK